MAGKSLAKKELLEYCVKRLGETGLSRICPVTENDSDKKSAHMVLIDGFVLMDTMGNAASKPTLPDINAYDMVAEEAPDSDSPDDSDSDEDLNIAQSPPRKNTRKPQMVKKEDGMVRSDEKIAQATALHESATKQGRWKNFIRNILSTIEREIRRPEVMTVVFGFDKKKYVDEVKRITHVKRSSDREKMRARQIQRDTDLGLEHTRGIPFTFDEINLNDLMPYPWTEVRSSSTMLQATIRYICLSICRDVDIPEGKDCTLIIDGHLMEPGDLNRIFGSSIQTPDHDTPVAISKAGIFCAKHYKNKIGEFDHTMFHYVTMFIDKPLTAELYSFNVRDIHQPISIRFRTVDTDALIMGLVYLEEMRRRSHDIELTMVMPGRQGAKDTCIYVNRVFTVLKKNFPHLEYPASTVAYALYLKLNDYDMPFLEGCGHKTIMNALVYHSVDIGDIAFPNPDVAIAHGLNPQSKIIDPMAIQRLIMAVLFQHKYFGRDLKEHKEKPYEKQKQINEKMKVFRTEYQYSEYIDLFKNSKFRAPSVEEIIEKSLRHQYFICLNEDLMFMRPRSIPFSQIRNYGYTINEEPSTILPVDTSSSSRESD